MRQYEFRSVIELVLNWEHPFKYYSDRLLCLVCIVLPISCRHTYILQCLSAAPYGGFSFGAVGGLIYPQSQEVQKKCSKTVNFLQFLLKTRSFLTKNAKKCKFLLIFTPIFTPKTNKSYKITLFTTANYPIFQNFP
jgi:hypothetical protein